MSEDQFTKLFKYVQDMRSEINERFTDTNKRVDEVGYAVDELAAQVRDYHNESIFPKHHVDKLTEAIK